MAGIEEEIERFNRDFWQRHGGTEPVRLPVPPDLLEGLERYLQHRIETGSFLRAVLENNLKEAVGTASPESQRALCAIVSWCYNRLPQVAWGSPEKVQRWLARKEAE